MSVILQEHSDDDSDSENQKSFSHNSFLLRIFILITCIKIILIPTYHSTDFEVHRNWLAITHNLPIDEWYKSDKSEWTLDYPPFFAWFEYLLSKVAAAVDINMLKIDNFNYASLNTKLFQRATVIFTDVFLVYGIKEVNKVFFKSENNFISFALLVLGNIGLLIVDHIHFQYNGFLLGILLISLAKVSNYSNENQILLGAFWFAILLNLKHIYLYIAPAYAVWILKCYCFKDYYFIPRFLKLGIILLSVIICSFGPYYHQLPQVLGRLFPFKRGLIHAYWAANAWALYAGMDKILSIVWKKFGWLNSNKIASMTGGLVKEDSFTVLPTPSPIVTFLITVFLMMPCLWYLFFSKSNQGLSKRFIRCIVLCALTSFMFGWHVHEKAILTAIIPLSILAVTDSFDARIFLILSSAGHTSLMPLLFENNLTPLKFILFFLYLITLILLFKKQYLNFILYLHEKFYIGLLPFVIFYETVLHTFFFNDKLPFLPLAITSLYCASGVTYSYVTYYFNYISKK